MNETNTAKVRTSILARAARLNVEPVAKLLNGWPFILAGGALAHDKPNDYDLYSVEGFEFRFDLIESKCIELGFKIIENSANAMSVDIGGQTVQFCKFFKPSLKELVASFDFAHCQVGVFFDGHKPCNVAFTEDYIAARLIDSTFFTGSEYPLASLVHCCKIASKGKFASSKDWKRACMEILVAILDRGVADYQDFCDQLNAVSEGICEDDIATRLYSHLSNK